MDGTTGYSNNYIRSATVLSSPLTYAITYALSTALFNCQSVQERSEMVNSIKESFVIDIEFATLKIQTVILDIWILQKDLVMH